MFHCPPRPFQAAEEQSSASSFRHTLTGSTCHVKFSLIISNILPKTLLLTIFRKPTKMSVSTFRGHVGGLNEIVRPLMNVVRRGEGEHFFRSKNEITGFVTLIYQAGQRSGFVCSWKRAWGQFVEQGVAARCKSLQDLTQRNRELLANVKSYSLIVWIWNKTIKTTFPFWPALSWQGVAVTAFDYWLFCPKTKAFRACRHLLILFFLLFSLWELKLKEH